MTTAAGVVDVLASVLNGRKLSFAEAEIASGAILDGNVSDAQVGALLGGMRVRGETVAELSGFAAGLLERATPFGDAAASLHPGAPLVDTCGTGGDGSGSLNISTLAALLAAAAGLRVAKHGNRSVSSRTGSADLIAALGIDLEADVERLHEALDRVGITFLYAPRFHPALRRVAAVRRQLGVRTIYNLLGPLANPARPSHRVVGVFDAAYLVPMAEALRQLGAQRAAIVHGEGGLDEIHPSGPTQVVYLDGDRITEAQLTPADFGLEPVDPAGLRGGEVEENLQLGLAILDGAVEPAAARQAIVMTAAMAVHLVRGTALPAATQEVAALLAAGAARRVLAAWQAIAGPAEAA